MTTIILVSHSAKIVSGLSDMIDQMVHGSDMVKVVQAGGTEDGRLGTDPMKIMNAIQESGQSNHILVFCDIGSSIMSTTSAMDLIDDEELKKKVVLVDAPLVEGAFGAAVTASTTDDLATILEQVKEAKETKKF